MGFRFGSVSGQSLCLLLVASLLSAGCEPAAVDYSGPLADWPAYGGDLGGLKYSPLTQITRDNVGDLEIAWTYHSGDKADGSGEWSKTSFSANPPAI